MTQGSAITITTPRLVLREMRVADAAELCRIVTQPDVGRMLFLFPPDWTEDAAKDFIAKVGFGTSPNGRLAICDAAGRFLGSVGIAERGGGTEVFYFLDPAVAGLGYATEAMSGFLRWIKATYGPQDMTAYVFQDNPGSARVMEKLGFVLAGEAVGRSAARLEPYPDWVYRLSQSREEGREG